jgi:hypothetical protein
MRKTLATGKGRNVAPSGLDSLHPFLYNSVFSMRELAARIRAVLRRSVRMFERPMRFGDVEVDLERRSVRRRSDDVKMTPAEYNLLLSFLHNADRVLTHNEILKSVWGYGVLPQYAHGGCTRRSAAAEAGAESGRAVLSPYRSWGRLSFRPGVREAGSRSTSRSLMCPAGRF